MPVGFDSTTLSILLNPDAGVPLDPDTGKLIDHAKERIKGLVEKLQKEKEKIVIPAPVTAEILTVVGPTYADYLTIINRSRVFEVVPLDEKAAIELAFLNRDVFAANDKKANLSPWQKVKVDRQILAICKVARCDTLYTDDNGLIASAKLCGITPVRLAELPVPEAARQKSFDLEPHEELPEMDEDEVEEAGEDEEDAKG
jgi:predicted nucleic acid-binding protein